MRQLEDIRSIHSADVEALGDVLPVNAWHVDGRILVDTGLVETTLELDAEWPITLRPWPERGPIEAVINTHLHFDHCGGKRRFARVPTYVQRAELAAVAEPDYPAARRTSTASTRFVPGGCTSRTRPSRGTGW